MSNNDQLERKIKLTDELIKAQLATSSQVSSSFFFHWSLLGSGTFALLIPFLQSLTRDGAIIRSTAYVVWGGGILILSILSSALRNLIFSEISFNAGITNLTGQTQKGATLLSSLNTVISWTAVLSYVVAISLIAYFVKINVLQAPDFVAP